MKVVSGEFAQGGKVRTRFEREAEILQQFRHPNIVRFLALAGSGGPRTSRWSSSRGSTLEKRILEQRAASPGARWSTWGSRSATRCTMPTSTAWSTAT